MLEKLGFNIKLTDTQSKIKGEFYHAVDGKLDTYRCFKS